MICQLTGMDVANASMYDASTAVPEPPMMAIRATAAATSSRPQRASRISRSLADLHAHQGIPLAECGTMPNQANSTSQPCRAASPKTPPPSSSRPQLLRHRRRREASRAIAHDTEHFSSSILRAVSLGLLEPPQTPISSPANCSPSHSHLATATFRGVIACKEKLIRQIPDA